MAKRFHLLFVKTLQAGQSGISIRRVWPTLAESSRVGRVEENFPPLRARKAWVKQSMRLGAPVERWTMRLP